MACLTSLTFIYRYVDGLVTSVTQTAKGTISNCDTLVVLLESIEHFLIRLDFFFLDPFL
jgi:hypothetical protein